MLHHERKDITMGYNNGPQPIRTILYNAGHRSLVFNNDHYAITFAETACSRSLEDTHCVKALASA
jgi:hypothetical protein